MDEKKHNISVIIPSLGNQQNLKTVLDSIMVQDIQDYEVLLVINGINDSDERRELAQFVKNYPEHIRLFFLDAKGINLARNYGIERAQSEVLFFLDDDCQLSYKSFLKDHVSYHNQHAEVFAYGGGYTLSPAARYFDVVYNDLQMRWFLSGLMEAPAVKFLLGGNFSVKSSLIKANAIYFDESIVYGGTEFDFFTHAHLSALKMYMNQLNLFHLTRESFFSLTRKLYKQGKGKAIVDSKYPASVAKEVGEESGADSEHRWILAYFNYVFWFGYYRQLKSECKFILHIASDCLNKINFLRFKALQKIGVVLSNKKNDGDRF